MSEKNPSAVASECRRLAEQLRIEADLWSGETRRRLIRDAGMMMKLARVVNAPETRGDTKALHSITETCEAATEIVVNAAVDRIDREWAKIR